MTTYLEKPKSRKLTPPSAGEDVEQMDPSFTAGNANGTATLMAGWWLPIKLNPLSLQDPAMVLIYLCLKEFKTSAYTKTCTQICTAPIFITCAYSVKDSGAG